MTQLAKIDPVDKLAEIASRASFAFEDATENLSQCFAVAEAITDLREAITDEMMGRVLKLMNTRLGFRTDRDPKLINKKTGEPFEPYPVSVVKECFIESVLRGLKPVGNQWNIISGELYITQEGYLYKLRSVLEDFCPVAGIPKRFESGAIVPYKATYRRKRKPGSPAGEAETYACDIPVRTLADSNAQQILGKAARQFYRRIFDIVSSRIEPADDQEEHQQIEAEPTEALPPPSIDRAQGPAPKPAQASRLWMISDLKQMIEARGDKPEQVLSWASQNGLRAKSATNDIDKLPEAELEGLYSGGLEKILEGYHGGRA